LQKNQKQKVLLKKFLKQSLFLISSILLLSGCAADKEEPYPPKWVVASQYLPKEKLKGLQRAGFFEIQDSIYSHHCDRHGNMIRLKYDEEGKTWKQIKYETLGCVE
jgi:hypothetical protein